MTPFIQMGIALLELAATVGPDIVEAIRSNGSLTDVEKDALIARVSTARAKVAAYEPRDPDATPPA